MSLHHELLANHENEQMKRGIKPVVGFMDDHSNHIKIHSKDGFLSQEQLDHVQEHINMLHKVKEIFSPEQEIRLEFNNPTQQVLNEVSQERARQENKWGQQNHSPANWLMILGEEVGEVNKAALETYFKYEGADKDYSSYREELIQVAAVAVAMVESLDRNEKTV